MDRAEYLSATGEFFYQGEQIGEAVSSYFVTREKDPVRRYKWATLLQLETETKARLRPFLMRLGLGVEQTDISVQVAGFAEAASGKSWRGQMQDVADITDFYLEKFRAIEAAAPEGEEREMARVMVAHETTINNFAKRELAGDSVASEADMVAQLHWPLPPP
jgi:hypothetical protein